MKTLIIKLGATGDVVRTTPLLRRLESDVTWITEAKNVPLLTDLSIPVRVLSWEERDQIRGASFDLVINLEDQFDQARLLQDVKSSRVFGAFLDDNDRLTYSADSRAWFDLSLISRFGPAEADRLKLQNRATYQELIFSGLGLRFEGERYLLPRVPISPLQGDVAISTAAGPVWPMKQWAYYDELKEALEARGLQVNVLPTRPTLLEHLADVQGHRCVVSGDSLPMHLALGSGVQCVSIFNCTSPWEIYGYGLLTKMVSPRLAEFFYKRGCDKSATTAVTIDEVLAAVRSQCENASTPKEQLAAPSY